MKRALVAVAVLFGTSGVAAASADGGVFWTLYFWQVLQFIAESGGIWNL